MPVVFLSICCQSFAQNSGRAITADQIRAKAGKYKEFKQLLADPDPSIRFAAISEMLLSDDKNMKALAFDAGFQSAESVIRAMVLKERVLSLTTLVFEPVSADDEAALAAVGANRVVVAVSSPNATNGSARFDGPFHYTGSASVSGEELMFMTKYSDNIRLAGRLRLGDNGKLMGTVHWNYVENSKLKSFVASVSASIN